MDLRLLRAAVFTAVCVVLSAVGHALAAGRGVPLWTLAAGFVLVFLSAAPLAGRERTLPGIAVALALGQTVLHTLFSCGHSAPGTPGPGSGGIRSLAGQVLCNDAAAAALTDAQARRLVTAAGLDGAPARAAAQAGGDGPAAAAGGPAADGAGSALDPLQAALGPALAQLSGPMLLGHLLAAVAAGWLLRRGEAALWRLVRLSGWAARAAEDALSVRVLRRALRLVRALLSGAPETLPPRVTAVPEDRTAPARTRVLTGEANRRGPPLAAERLALAA
ncbi:hypothetical protein [Streptomyces sp. JJ36]|uniref:hypothetical protein n=1 Tax=Streptomyces sp. JJ36 TaxID=2736645 RepID=UPI001F19BED7|nr:hypothetical protein [Streptomyces sp. JJ36]